MEALLKVLRRCPASTHGCRSLQEAAKPPSVRIRQADRLLALIGFALSIVSTRINRRCFISVVVVVVEFFSLLDFGRLHCIK